MTRPRYLVDTSVIARLGRSTAVRKAWDDLRARGDIVTCLPYALEAGYSARSASDHRVITAGLAGDGAVLSSSARTIDIALGIQQRLFEGGMGRAAGVIDIIAVATGIAEARRDAPISLIHYDADYDHIWSVRDPAWEGLGFSMRWVVERGSVD